MPDLHAFVSHSFLEQDAKVVEKFIKLFDRVEGLHSQFKWGRAIRAEPRSLSEKVMRVFEGKNTLIAICTKREQVYAPSHPNKAEFFGRQLVSGKELTWKTSDWILQEIGLGKGRDLTIIIFLENGVSPPSGLTADIQHIRFDRSYPEAAYSEFMEMIASINPVASPQLGIETQAQMVHPQSQEQPEGAAKESDEPRADWGQDEYDRALFWSMYSDREAKVQEIYEAYKKSPLSKEPKQEARWSALKEFFTVLAEKGSSLEPLLELTKTHPNNEAVWDYLGQAYGLLKMNSQAANAKEKAAELEADASKKTKLLGDAAIFYSRAGVSQEAARLLRLMVDATTAETEKSVLRALEQYAAEAKELEFQLGALEVLSERDPLDADVRFSLGFQYDSLDENRAALLHYLGIPEQKRGGAAWNNLGYTREKLKLTIGTVRAYQKAIDDKESLAFSNLAKRYLSAGFIEEALEVCDKGLAALPNDKDISECKVYVQSQRDAELKLGEKILVEARPVSGIYLQLGKAMLRPSIHDLPTNWHGPKSDLMVTLKGDRITAAGEYTEQPSGLASAIAQSFGPQTPLTYRVEYEGTVRGRAVVGSVQQSRAASSTLLGSWSSPTPFVMFISNDGRTIEVIEEPRGAKPKRYKFEAK